MKNIRMIGVLKRLLTSLLFIAYLLGQLAFAQTHVSLVRADQQPVGVVVYKPIDNSCQGSVIVSPGAGGSENDLRYLGMYLSTNRYLTVVVGHNESGRQALRDKIKASDLKEGLNELITDTSAYQARLLDIAAAKQWASTECHKGLSFLAGHSMGAATTLMIAGARNKVGIESTLGFDGYIAMSPQGVGTIFPNNAWTSIHQPVLILTGTRDTELNSGTWKTRTASYESMPAGCKWLGVIDGASHLNFAGIGFSRRTESLSNTMIGAFLSGVEQGRCDILPTLPNLDTRSK